MIGTRIATGLLATAVAAVVVGCAPTAEPQTDTASAYPSETLAPLFQQMLPNVRDTTFTSAIVTFPPAARAVPHRHGDAFVYAYVLEGAVSSQLEGEPAHVYHRGENWSEQPGAHHLATENASTTEPAKLLVVFVATTGEQLKIDHPHR
ncbi:cupin domain-containing protein [Rhodococcus opacus]|uniref:cupin domain-containing protein n=1 Tax=Rhodococcus opacus TaxID=37919 RepID=UPI00247389E8|nr:cupin domain-containing protein [Rhodococcus opacus]MDH6289709.1 quercetin dioxygenase-like cupin family protein [Rhodococcus opacus]